MDVLWSGDTGEHCCRGGVVVRRLDVPGEDRRRGEGVVRRRGVPLEDGRRRSGTLFADGLRLRGEVPDPRVVLRCRVVE